MNQNLAVSRALPPLTESIDLAYRRRIYTAVVGAGTLAVFLALLVSPSRDPYQHYLAPTLLVLGLFDLWWLATKRSLHVAEVLGYSALALATVAHVALLTFLPSPPTFYPNSGPYWTLICVLTLGFLTFSARLAWSVNLCLTAVCLALPWLAHSSYAFQNPSALFRLHCSVLVMLLLLGTLAALRRKVDETEQAQEAMRILAFTDTLTALPNRRAIYPAVEDLLRVSQQSGTGTLHLIDIDHFKKVNDVHGHGVGDEILVALAQLIATCETVPNSPPPTVGRWGGEEFIVVLPATDRTLSEQRGNRLLEECRSAQWPKGLNLTVSMGSSTVRPGDTFFSLLARADEALYSAKAAGRDRIMFDS